MTGDGQTVDGGRQQPTLPVLNRHSVAKTPDEFGRTDCPRCGAWPITATCFAHECSKPDVPQGGRRVTGDGQTVDGGAVPISARHLDCKNCGHSLYRVTSSWGSDTGWRHSMTGGTGCPLPQQAAAAKGDG